MPDRPVLLWLRRDLRLADHPALTDAVATGRPVIPVFILDDETPGQWRLGGAQRWWLHHSLTALTDAFSQRGSRLVLRRGPTASVLAGLVGETGADCLFAGTPVEPWGRRLAASLDRDLGIPVQWRRTLTLFEPDALRTRTGGAYGVFTPFARAARERGTPAAPLPAPDRIPGPTRPPKSDRLEDWGLLPNRPDWAAGFRAFWLDGPGGRPGEAEAGRRLQHFTTHLLEGYADARNTPGIDGSSILSPRLHWGEISPNQAWHAALAAHAGEAGTQAWTNELLWREFSADLLWHHPDLPERPLRPEFAAMPWRKDDAALHAWQHGRTGLPIVDAGMRQLWRIGWMHNRVRMIVASFLIKHLLLSWEDGAAWFWDTLVDADLASNSAQWQWVAGSGADAAPFFRIFNPVLQGRKFDPDGGYVRQWVPELAKLPGSTIHAPWELPEPILEKAGLSLGAGYPRPIVSLSLGRDRALAAFRSLRQTA